MPVNCKIIKNIERPDPALVARFKGMPVANIDDCMGRMAAIDSSIKAFGKGQLLGTALTVKVPAGDNLMFHASLDLAKPGDVIVIDAGGHTERAIFGELMITYCKLRGIKGVIVDGAIRDQKELSEMEDFQVYAKAVTPNGPYKNGPGEINTPIIVGGKMVYPGDIVVGDSDGVLFIRPEEAAAIADATEKVQKMEDGIRAKFAEDGSYDRPWVATKLAAIGCEIIE